MMPDLPWFVYAFPFLMIGLVVAAALYKFYQVREAAGWPSVPGKVVVSEAQMRHVKVMDDIRRTDDTVATEARNFANVVFEYRVGGKIFRNDRVSIGEDLGNFEVAATLQKYPVGTAVTVYYDPRDPEHSVLERDAPRGLWGCVGALVVVGVAGVFLTFYGFNQLGLWLTSLMPSGGNAKAAAAFAIFGGVLALFAGLFQWQASRKKQWPVAPGRIVESSVEQFTGRDRDDRTSKTYYRSRLIYAYEVGGVTYRGTAAHAGGRMTSTIRRVAQKQAEKYRPGQNVMVYVSPDNPSDSVLDPRARGIWIVWIAVVAVFAASYYAATH